MPNYVKTRISFTSDNRSEIDDIIAAIQDDEGYIDFNTVIPMPENIYTGNLGQAEREKYGSNNWYDWSIANWGTKWNACESYCDENVVEFETAWAPATPVFDAIAEKFFTSGTPSNMMIVEWADEDIGSNCGKRVYIADASNGFVCDDIWPDDPTRFALEIWDYDEDEYFDDEDE